MLYWIPCDKCFFVRNHILRLYYLRPHVKGFFNREHILEATLLKNLFKMLLCEKPYVGGYFIRDHILKFTLIELSIIGCFVMSKATLLQTFG